MKELKFTSPEQYLSYDFDDNFLFFYDELEGIAKSIDIIDPDYAPLIDFEKEFSKFIFDLFKIYDCLVLIPDEETLYGEIGGKRFFIREGKREE